MQKDKRYLVQYCNSICCISQYNSRTQEGFVGFSFCPPLSLSSLLSAHFCEPQRQETVEFYLVVNTRVRRRTQVCASLPTAYFRVCAHGTESTNPINFNVVILGRKCSMSVHKDVLKLVASVKAALINNVDFVADFSFESSKSDFSQTAYFKQHVTWFEATQAFWPIKRLKLSKHLQVKNFNPKVRRLRAKYLTAW